MHNLILTIRSSRKLILLTIVASAFLFIIAGVSVYAYLSGSARTKAPDAIDTSQSTNPNTPTATPTQPTESSKTAKTTTEKTNETAAPTATPETPSAPSQPTPAPTSPSTGGFQSNCIVVPHVCGYPDETNTGVPAGTTPTNSGSITVTQDGAVIENLNVSGYISVQANSVTIRKTRITSSDYYPISYYGGYTGLTVEDTQIIGLSSTVTAGISFDNYTARRVDISGTADGLKANENVLIEDSYIHDLAYDAIEDTHNDGVQTTGGNNVTLRHNTFKLSMSDGINACIQMGNEGGGNTNWLVTNNLFDGGGWQINASPEGTNRTFSNNRFTRNYGYGVGYVDNSVWTGNYYDNDGTAVEN